MEIHKKKRCTQTGCAPFIFSALRFRFPTCKPSKIPLTLGATCENTFHAPYHPDFSVKPLAFNLWDSHI